jgi:hypothetical protein
MSGGQAYQAYVVRAATRKRPERDLVADHRREGSGAMKRLTPPCPSDAALLGEAAF